MNDKAIWNKHREELVDMRLCWWDPADAEGLLSVVVVGIPNRRRLADLDDRKL